jgi:hypothetical protein
MKCATCNETTGCEHIQLATNTEKFQEVLAERSERAGVPEPTQVYVPGNREYRTPVAGATRGPSVVIGARGDRGPEGKIGATGLPGRDGKNADIKEVISLATLAMREELSDAQEKLRKSIVVELKVAGVVDQFGIAIPGARGAAGVDGLSGRNGLDSTVAGPQGVAGKDCDFEALKLAAHEMMKAELATMHTGLHDRLIRETKQAIVDQLKQSGVIDQNGKAILIAGAKGLDGKNGADSTVPGPRGGAGDISAAVGNAERYVQAELAKFREEIKGGVS